MLRGLYLIDAHHEPGLRIFDVPVGVNDARRVLKDRLDLLRNLGLSVEVGTVDLGHQCLHHGRSGRNFADLNARAVLVADGVEQRAEPLGNRVALHAALLGGQQIHLNVGLVRLAAHVVVAHQPVEVIGPRCRCRSGNSARRVDARVRRPAPAQRGQSARAACHRAY